MIEPHNYMPVLPVVLMNGAAGIGTGWSTDIPCFSPREIAENFLNVIRGGEFSSMKPYYKGYTGTFEPIDGKKSYNNKGSYILRSEDDILEITELPIQKWTKDYKVELEKMLEAGEIDDFAEKHTSSRVHFKILLPRDKTRQWDSMSEA